MSIDLDTTSKAKLIAKVTEENVRRGYWPSDVSVRLEQFYKIPSLNGSVTKYHVRAVGSYFGQALVEYDSRTKVLYPTIRLSKGTEGFFTKEELAALGINLPE